MWKWNTKLCQLNFRNLICLIKNVVTRLLKTIGTHKLTFYLISLVIFMESEFSISNFWFCRNYVIHKTFLSPEMGVSCNKRAVKVWQDIYDNFFMYQLTKAPSLPNTTTKRTAHAQLNTDWTSCARMGTGLSNITHNIKIITFTRTWT